MSEYVLEEEDEGQMRKRLHTHIRECIGVEIKDPITTLKRRENDSTQCKFIHIQI